MRYTQRRTYWSLEERRLRRFRIRIALFALGALFGRFRPRVLLMLVPIALLAGYGLDYVFTEILYVDLPQRSLLGGS